MNQQTTSTLTLAFCGMSVAIVVLCAWVTIPIGLVPVTLQIFGVCLALVVLPKREFLLVVGAYLLMGAVGLPVFSSMRGGLAVFVGPTGGFLWGYIIAGVVAATLLEMLENRQGRKRWHEVLACIVFLAFVYVCGWAQLMLVAGLEPLPALFTAVVPFVPFDAVKIAVAIVVGVPIRAAIQKRLRIHA